jgi:hypothetical protein
MSLTAKTSAIKKLDSITIDQLLREQDPFAAPKWRRAAAPLEPAETIAASCAAFATDLLQTISRGR